MTSQIKPVAGLERSILAEVVPLQTPYTVFLFPTTFCNFKCKYCGHSLGHEKMKEQYGFQPQTMSMETFQKAVEQLKEFGDKMKVLSLTGHGEPLLHPHIVQMVKEIKQADIAQRIEIITNASLLTKELSEGLIEAGLDCLRISIQGVSTSKYQEICGTEIGFDEIVGKIDYFYQHKGNCEVFVKTMDVAVEDDLEKNLFYTTFRKRSDRMFIEKCKPVYDGVPFTETINTVTDRYGRQHKPRAVCPLCFFMLGVFPNGDVEPCDTIYKSVCLGNINSQTLLSMWNGKTLKEFRSMQLKKERYKHPKCSVCCAPDDVSHPEDQLDDYCEEILQKL